MLPRLQVAAVVGTAAILLVVGGVVVYVGTRSYSRGPASTSSSAETVATPAQVAEQYQVGLRAAVAELEPLLDHKLSSQDQAALASIRNTLLGLSVPPEDQAFHLKLVLKVSLLHELLTPGTVTAASRGVPTVASTQAELKRLLVSSPVLVR